MSTRRRLALCAGAIALILLVDAVRTALEPSVYPLALLDWTAHVATAVTVLVALGIPLTALWTRVALGAVVLLDADHLPAHLAGTLLQQGRPPTHSLTTLVAVALAAALLRGRARVVVAGIAAGVALHLLRDAATGPGFVSWPPLTDATIRAPYLAYLAVLGACLAVAAARGRTARAPLRPVRRPQRQGAG